MNTVTVYDIQNKFIAYSAPVPEVLDVLFEWGSIYIIAGDRKVGLYIYISVFLCIKYIYFMLRFPRNVQISYLSVATSPK